MAPSFSTAVKFALPLCTVAGYFSTWVMFERTGTKDLMNHIRDFKPLLPGASVPLKRQFTGLTGFDTFLTILITFFEPVLNGHNPAASLQTFEFLGQVLAVVVLSEVEARRLGNSRNVISLSLLWLLVSQGAAFANIIPIYFLVHLLTSPTALEGAARSPKGPHADLSVAPAVLHALPVSATLTYIIPAILMVLPAPSVVSYTTHQNLVAVWQVFPIWLALSQAALSRALALIVPERKYQSSSERNAHVLRSLRPVYIFAFGVASITHIAAWSISLAALLLPGMFSSAIAPGLQPSATFLAPAPWSTAKVTSLADGAHNFLVYDHLFGHVALLLWATALNRNAHSGRGSPFGWVAFVAKTAALSLVAGPASAAVVLVWGRDEMVLGDMDVRMEKKTS